MTSLADMMRELSLLEKQIRPVREIQSAFSEDFMEISESTDKQW